MNSIPSITELFEKMDAPGASGKVFALLDRKYTYSDFCKSIRKATTLFQEEGWKSGDHIYISSLNHFAVTVLFFTCLRNGYTAVVTDPEIGPKRAAQLFEVVKPDGFIVDQEVAEQWKIKDSSVPTVQIGEKARKKGALLKKMLRKNASSETTRPKDLWQRMDQATPATLPDSVDPESIAYILFTSGSTSVPKAVEISQKALMLNLSTLTNVYGLSAESNIFNILSMYHTDGLTQGPVLAAFNLASWYHPMNFEVGAISRIFDAIYKYRISHFITVPTMLNLMYKFGEGYEDSFQTQEFKHIITSAAPFECRFWRDFEEKFNCQVVNVYGLTETVAGASYCGPDSNSRKIGSIGKPVDCEFRILMENGQEARPEEQGQLLIRGGNLLTAYHNNPEATERGLKDDWFHTGDIAKVDDDGFYFITGRKKNIIITGGINIHAEEVTEVLNNHPLVFESACTSLPDPLFDEILVAGIVLMEGAEMDDTTLADFCRQELEEAKVPRQIHFLKALPKTASGKVHYQQLKETILSAGQASFDQEGKKELQDSILQAAAKAFKKSADQIDFASANTLSVEGWDSLAHLDFVTTLEKQFNVRFSTKEIMNMASLVDAHNTLQNKIPSA